MTPTLDDVEQLVGLPADGDATVIGGTWGFLAILEIFGNNLLQDLNAFKSLKAGGIGNLLSLRKLEEHYAYKLVKVLSDSTAAATKKNKGITARSVARAYMLYVLGSFLFLTKTGTDVSVRYLYLFAKNKITMKWSWGSTVLAHMYYNLGIASQDDGRKEASVNEHGDTPVHQSKDIAEQYDASQHEHVSPSPNSHGTMQIRGGSGDYDQQITTLNDQLQKLKDDKEKESEANINLREALKENILECKNLEEQNTSLVAELRQKSGLEDCNKSLFVELNKNCKESESLKAANTLLMEQIDMQLPPATLLAVLQSHQPVPDTTLAKKYEDLLAAHENRQKLVNAEERMKSLKANNSECHNRLVNSEERKKTLEVDNSEWEVWRQALKKTLSSEGMGDMGDPTFEEFFEQNERFFTIAQQGPKGDYQEDLVSTAVTLENIVIARREKMANKKKIQELLFQPRTKYLVDVRGVEISDNNSGFKVTAAIQHQSQHRFPNIMKSLKTFLCKDPAFWKSIFSQILGIQFTPDGENAYQILLQACSYGHQHVEYRHMAHLLSTYYENVVVFISHTEAYTFLPLFWARKRNTTSNEERFQNLLMDT
ncbi:hypothetical protein GIB67_000659, partial [Kingdonia uniflora]